MLSRRSVGPVEIVLFFGALDAAATPAARQGLKEILDEGHRRVIIDLSQVSFMDSSGLAILVTALKVARAGGGDVLSFSAPDREDTSGTDPPRASSRAPSRMKQRPSRGSVSPGD